MLRPGIYSLADLSITTAVTSLALTPINGLEGMEELSVEFNFAYGSGGTTLKAWLQTSLSQGTRWRDLACFAATTASKQRDFSLRRTLDSALWTPGNGVLADDIIASSIVFGDQLRLLLTTTGTYAGGTVISVRAAVA
jgi:hypothetical protein